MSKNPSATHTSSASFKARFWDRFASGYAGGTIGDWAGYERSLVRTRKLLGPGASVLEIGCGTGSTALTLSLFTGPYLATDIAPQMIALANQRLALSPRPALHFQVDDSDAMASDLAGPFDAVLAFNVLHLLDNLDEAVARCARVLRPGGLLIAKTPCLLELNPLIPYLAVPLMRAVRLAPPVLSLREADLVAACKRQGLEVLSVERHASRGRDVRPFVVARKPAGEATGA
jgi:SAM-dependent methyltransferase